MVKGNLTNFREGGRAFREQYPVKNAISGRFDLRKRTDKVT